MGGVDPNGLARRVASALDYTIHVRSMTRMQRLALAGAGLVMVLCACLLVAYAVWPADRRSEQVRPAPTYFVAP